ncbi:hypothetical protein LS66_007505 [Helicobacter sp. MIT 03-1614]|uniref:hypothetical protein n=1 Tax=Helicobacter sp. MIT 03-1614 TaxID=1548147 RepID=UPI0005142D4B|nr:hypothetical protein [Helicobacter sp. MIT 03-1614]TLD87732.1 hypothetical protein LS66_007505 [Helicobacter sp. MIT 03-1614]
MNTQRKEITRIYAIVGNDNREFYAYSSEELRDVDFIRIAQDESKKCSNWQGVINTASSAEAFLNEHCDDGIIVYKRVENILVTTITELCPFCENEVKLQPFLRFQSCPACSKIIIPCSLCVTKDCSYCPLVQQNSFCAELSIFDEDDENHIKIYTENFESSLSAENYLLSQMQKVLNKHLALNLNDDDWSDEAYNDKKTQIAYWLNDNLRAARVIGSNGALVKRFDFHEETLS